LQNYIIHNSPRLGKSFPNRLKKFFSSPCAGARQTLVPPALQRLPLPAKIFPPSPPPKPPPAASNTPLIPLGAPSRGRFTINTLLLANPGTGAGFLQKTHTGPPALQPPNMIKSTTCHPERIPTATLNP
jgi:hypothetical protein